jgi:hypothetical protein
MSGNDLSTLHRFNGWRCDSCGELITSIDSGWVESLSSEGDRGEDVLSGLQLVHHGSVLPNGAGRGCRYDHLNARAMHYLVVTKAVIPALRRVVPSRGVTLGRYQVKSIVISWLQRSFKVTRYRSAVP